jgi:hypothetical protein
MEWQGVTEEGPSATGCLPTAQQIAIELVLHTVAFLVSSKTLGSSFIALAQLTPAGVLVCSTDDFTPSVGKFVLQKFRAAPTFLQTPVATVMGDTAPICCILGGSFATQATVATIEGVTDFSSFSRLQQDHRPEIVKTPLGLD